ncbi:hypothetical protein VB779_21560 [Haloarculaceae archaeon H-GB11]|nr:hypothetical protein [Haloarculaceae archaeon H-GB11]
MTLSNFIFASMFLFDFIFSQLPKANREPLRALMSPFALSRLLTTQWLAAVDRIHDARDDKVGNEHHGEKTHVPEGSS